MFEDLFGQPTTEKKTPEKKKAPIRGGMFDDLFAPEVSKAPTKQFGEVLEHTGWEQVKKRGEMTESMQKMREVGFAPPTRELGMSIGQMRKDTPDIQESKGKDIIDGFILSGSELLYSSKRSLLREIPNMLLPDMGKMFLPEEIKNDYKEAKNIMKKGYEKKYDKAEERYNKWVLKHPELEAREGWDKPVLQTLTDDPATFSDPAYWAYIASRTAAFTLGMMGVTVGVTLATKNPFLGVAVGVAVTVPAISQDLYEDLVTSGASKEQAEEISRVVGPIISMVEVVGQLPILKAIGGPFASMFRKKIVSEVTKKTLPYIVKHGIKNFAAIEAGEVLEEIVQGAIQDGTVSFFDENRSLIENIPETTITTLIATTPFALLGVGAGVNQDIGIKVRQEVKDQVKVMEREKEKRIKEERPEVKLKPKEEVIAPKEEIKPKEDIKAIKEEIKPGVELKPLKQIISKFEETGTADIVVGEDYGISIKDEGEGFIRVIFGPNKLTKVGEGIQGTRDFSTKEEAFKFVKEIQDRIAKVGEVKPIPKELEPLAVEAKKYKSVEEFVETQPTLYHGTNKTFDIFDDSLRGSVTGAKSAEGAIWFTDNQRVAKGYSVFAAEDAPVRNILEQAAKAEKVAQKSDKESDWVKYDALVRKSEELGASEASFERRKDAVVKEAYIQGNLYEVDAKGKTPQELSSDGSIDSWLNQQLEIAKKLNKDGVKITNLDDAAGLTDVPSTHYAIFNAKNIKTKSQLTDIYNRATKEVREVKPKEKPVVTKKEIFIETKKNDYVKSDGKWYLLKYDVEGKEFRTLVTKPSLIEYLEKKPVAEKLPEVKKIPEEKGVKLYAVGLMPDPGVDKFIAEEIRPVLNKVTEAAKYLWKITKYVPELMMRIVEPAKLVSGKPYAAVIRGIHHPEARLVEFDQKRLETIDSNISELEKWYNENFTDEELGNLMMSRGNPSTAVARSLQRDAINALPKEFKMSSQQKVIQEIADFNHEFLKKVAGRDIHKVEDYFYGMYGDPKKVNKFLDYWRSTERFMKSKLFATVADAAEYGLELKNKNPVANLRVEFGGIAKLEGMVWMREELLRTGKGIYIEETSAAPIKWDKVNDPVFNDLRVEPNLALLINHLISTNQITRIPVLNVLRKINNFLRTIKFVGSMFHALVIAKQSVADSGWFGFAYKKTATKGATFGFKKNDPIFQTQEYKDYIELGGGHKYSIEFDAKRALSDAMDKIYRGNYLGAFTKFGIFPTKLPLGFVNWMFNEYIPKVKYAKYLDFVVEKEKKSERMLTDLEKIEIIKEGQNFYGMMNERLFGRGGTATTLLRFVFMAPGYAEGNYRTIIKAFSQWGVKGTYGAGRSRFNIVNSLVLTGIMATVGTLILTGKPPKKPEKLEDIRDLFKIDTGKVDSRNRKIMIDLMTYDKDYWNITFNVLRGRPDIAVTESIKRVGGMKASTFGMILDFGLMLQGKAIYDWKEDKVFEITDPFLLKLQKLAMHELKRLEPISVSVYKQLREKEVDMVFAGIASMLGIRSTKTEADRRKQEITNQLFSLRDRQEQLYYYLGTIKNPREAIGDYNKIVNDILNAKMVPQEMRDEWGPKLLIDIDKLLSNKIYQITGPMTTLTKEEKADEIEKIKKYLKNFEVTIEEAEEHLKYYWKEHPVRNRWSKTHQENMTIRRVRLKERY